MNAIQRNEIIRLNSLMQAILNNVPVYLFIKDTGNDFRYLYWNKAFADRTGIYSEFAVGKTDVEIFRSDEEVRRFRRRLSRDGGREGRVFGRIYYANR